MSQAWVHTTQRLLRRSGRDWQRRGDEAEQGRQLQSLGARHRQEFRRSCSL